MKKVFVLSVSLLFLWGCNNTTKAEAEIEQLETEIQTEQLSDENSTVLELNDGEKWIVNEEMKPFVLKGEELVNTYVQNNQTDYTVLAEQLKDENNQLIKSCTMTGKSHEELHKWLHPHLEIVKALEVETDVTKSNETISKLQQSYLTYHQYFN